MWDTIYINVYHIMLHYIIRYLIILSFVILHHIVLYYWYYIIIYDGFVYPIMLYCIVLYSSISYYIILYSFLFQYFIWYIILSSDCRIWGWGAEAISSVFRLACFFISGYLNRNACHCSKPGLKACTLALLFRRTAISAFLDDLEWIFFRQLQLRNFRV